MISALPRCIHCRRVPGRSQIPVHVMHAYSVQRGMSKTYVSLMCYDGHNATVCRSYVPVLAQSPEQLYNGQICDGLGCQCGTPCGLQKYIGVDVLRILNACTVGFVSTATKVLRVLLFLSLFHPFASAVNDIATARISSFAHHALYSRLSLAGTWQVPAGTGRY